MPCTFLIHEYLGHTFLRPVDFTSFTFGEINLVGLVSSSTENSVFWTKRRLNRVVRVCSQMASNGNQKSFSDIFTRVSSLDFHVSSTFNYHKERVRMISAVYHRRSMCFHFPPPHGGERVAGGVLPLPCYNL